METIVQVSLTQALANKLSVLKPDITRQDMLDAEQTLKKEIKTITRYLNGKVANTELATQLIEFFTTKIHDRAKRANVSLSPAQSLAV